MQDEFDGAIYHVQEVDDSFDGAIYHVKIIGGGGDSHNLGWYETPTALNTAHPTAEAGDWAIVGSTDTVWVWDTDTTAWVDTDTKGQVTSVNGQTGAVTVQETLVSGTNIKTIDGNSVLGSGNLELSTYLTYPAGWTTNSTTKAFCDDIAADTTATAGKAYLGEVTCSDLPASLVNGEIVVEIMDGTTAANKVIKLTLSSGNVSPYMWVYTYWNGGTNTSGWQGLGGDTLPSQTGNSGKFLTTDGMDASWSDKPVQNTATGSGAFAIGGGTASALNGISVGKGASVTGTFGIAIGAYNTNADGGVAIGTGCQSNGGGVAIGVNNCQAQAGGGTAAIAIGNGQKATASGGIQLGTNTSATNSDANTFKVSNINGNFEIMSADGTIPHARLTNALSPTTVTIAVADWNGGTTCSKTISGLTATSVVFVAPDNASQSDYLDAGVYASSQTTDTLGFTCTTTPTSALTLTVVYC